MNRINRKRASKARIEKVRNLGSPLFQAFFGTSLPGKAFSVCIKDGKNIDPACGSGSLLLKFAKILGKENVRNGFYGQEINITTYNLCRINMFLHDIDYDKFDIGHGDTLTEPLHWDDEPFEAIEYGPENGNLRTRVFYCDAGCPHQKGAIEANHSLIRRVLPKGTGFNHLAQEDITRMMNHINSYKRKKLNNRSPYETFSFYHGEAVLHKLGCSPVPADDILLKPTLLKR